MYKYIRIGIHNEGHQETETLEFSKSDEGHIAIDLYMGITQDDTTLLQQHTIEIALHNCFDKLSRELAQHFSTEWTKEHSDDNKAFD